MGTITLKSKVQRPVSVSRNIERVFPAGKRQLEGPVGFAERRTVGIVVVGSLTSSVIVHVEVIDGDVDEMIPTVQHDPDG